MVMEMFYRDKNLGRQISSSMFLWIPCPKNTKTRTAEEGGYRSIKYFVNYHISTYSRENITTHLVMGSEDKKLNIKKRLSSPETLEISDLLHKKIDELVIKTQH